MKWIAKATDFLQSFVTPIDLLKGRFHAKRNKLKIGFCSAFPPTQNGAAAFAYYFVRELAKIKSVQVFAIPLGNRIDKKLFRGICCANVSDRFLDAIIFFCIGMGYEKIASKAKVPTIAWQTMHVSPRKSEGELSVFKQVCKAHKIIVCTKHALQEYSNCGAKNVGYVPLGVDVEQFKPPKKDSALAKQGFLVLFVNRAQNYKGIVPFLEAMPFVLEKHHKTMFCLHAPFNENASDSEGIAKKIAETRKRFPENFIWQKSWVGFEKMPERYRAASVLVFPSNNEGFGIPPVEAMASGVPCIVSDVKPMNEIVLDKKTGFCLRPTRNYGLAAFPAPKAIAKKINYLIENDRESKKIGARGRKRAKKEFDLKKVVDKMLSEVKKLANAKKQVSQKKI